MIFSACYYCKSCHGDITDVRAIKKCRCKGCKYRVTDDVTTVTDDVTTIPSERWTFGGLVILTWLTIFLFSRAGFHPQFYTRLVILVVRG